MELRRVSVEPGLEHRRLEFRSPRDFDCASDYSGGQIENGREYNPDPVTKFIDTQPKFGAAADFLLIFIRRSTPTSFLFHYFRSPITHDLKYLRVSEC
ncbi:hypothetical protein ACS0TY_023885 [Phlomoides rotata]